MSASDFDVELQTKDGNVTRVPIRLARVSCLVRDVCRYGARCVPLKHTTKEALDWIVAYMRRADGAESPTPVPKPVRTSRLSEIFAGAETDVDRRELDLIGALWLRDRRATYDVLVAAFELDLPTLKAMLCALVVSRIRGAELGEIRTRVDPRVKSNPNEI